jgi:two-component system response regulator HydG
MLSLLRDELGAAASSSSPGSRALQNCIERAVALGRLDQLQVDDLPERIRTARSPATSNAPVATAVVPLEEQGRRHVTQVLQAVGGNKASAARALGLDRCTLYRMLARWRGVAPRDTVGR